MLQGIVEGACQGGILPGNSDAEAGTQILRRQIGPVRESTTGAAFCAVEPGREGHAVIENRVDLAVLQCGQHGIAIGVGHGFCLWEIVLQKRFMRRPGNHADGLVLRRLCSGFCKAFGIGGRKACGQAHIAAGEGEFFPVPTPQ